MLKFKNRASFNQISIISTFYYPPHRCDNPSLIVTTMIHRYCGHPWQRTGYLLPIDAYIFVLCVSPLYENKWWRVTSQWSHCLNTVTTTAAYQPKKLHVAASPFFELAKLITKKGHQIPFIMSWTIIISQI